MENNVKKIQVLGMGCPTCKKLFELTKQAVDELNLGVEVEYITDMEKIMQMGVMSTPVLAVNNVAVAAGQLPNLEQIKSLLTKQNKAAAGSSVCGCGHC